VAVDRNGHSLEFVSVGCQGLIMSKDKKQTPESADKLIVHARWVADYISNSNNQMLLRSATLIGFLAIEFSFIAAWDPEDFQGVHYYKWLFGIGLIFGFVSALCFVWAGKVKNFHYLNFVQIRYARTLKASNAIEEPLNALLYRNNEKDLFEQLHQENSHISTYFKAGMWLLVFSQSFLGLLLVLKWINS
jgi:hypothetical protein